MSRIPNENLEDMDIDIDEFMNPKNVHGCLPLADPNLLHPRIPIFISLDPNSYHPEYHVSPAHVEIPKSMQAKQAVFSCFLWASGRFQNICSGWNLGLADVRWAAGSIFGQIFDLIL